MPLKFATKLTADMFSGVSKPLATAAIMVANGLRPDPSKFNCYHHVLQHRQLLAAGGANTGTGTTPFTFFNAGFTKGQCNLDVSGQVPANQFFWAKKIRFMLEQNVTAAGGVTTAPTTYAAAVTPAWDAEYVRQISLNGLVNLKFGQRDIVRNVYGLYNFGCGGGPVLQGAVSTTASSTTVGAVQGINGNPDVVNGWILDPWQHIINGEAITASLEFTTSLIPGGSGMSAVSGSWMIEGTLIVANN